jgi:hypothetical protein
LFDLTLANNGGSAFDFNPVNDEVPVEVLIIGKGLGNFIPFISSGRVPNFGRIRLDMLDARCRSFDGLCF